MSVATFIACGGDDEPGALDNGDNTPDQMRDASMSGVAGSMPDASSEGSASGGAGGSGGSADEAGNVLGNCVAEGGAINCTGPGHCVIENGMPRCECDPGYVPTGPATAVECVVDRSCFKVRLLDGGCRVQILGTNAVSLFVAVDYCSGDPVLPADLGDVNMAFDVFENEVSVRDNPEGSVTIIEKNQYVESFVTIALDVSASISNDPALLRQLAQAIRGFVARLDSLRAPGEPPVTLAFMVFGGNVRLLVPPTQDVAAVNAALTQLESDPSVILADADVGSTALYLATERAILETERIKGFRHVVSDWGVLTSGTVVVVTDGGEMAGNPLNTQLLADTRVNLISVGVSSDISNAELSAIGRDGSFLAPTPEDWTAIFETIATRVDQHPDRTYLVGYCTPKRFGLPKVKVGLANYPDATTAECTFDATVFGRTDCVPAFFETECNNMSCGGVTACGACGPNECCDNGGRCVAPSSAPAWSDAPGQTCNGMDQLCHPTGEVCVDDLDTATQPGRFSCEPPLALGADCGQGTIGRCEDGVAYCADVPSNDGGTAKQCVPVKQDGAYCDVMPTPPRVEPGDPRQCPGLRCGREKPDNNSYPLVCLPPARMFDICGGDDARAVCEVGTGCVNNVCRLLAPYGLASCSTDQECATGYCDETVTHLCEYTGMCHYSWSEVLNR